MNFIWLQERSYSLANVTAVDIRGPDDTSSILGHNSITLNISLGAGASGEYHGQQKTHQQGCRSVEATEESHSRVRTHGLRVGFESINLGSKSLSAFAGCVTLNALPPLLSTLHIYKMGLPITPPRKVVGD